MKYFGVGNENWGCGGRMRAEYYADLYRRYGLYARRLWRQQALSHRLRADATTTIIGLKS